MVKKGTPTFDFPRYMHIFFTYKLFSNGCNFGMKIARELPKPDFESYLLALFESEISLK